MQIARKFKIYAPADRVWSILGPNYVRVGDWASSVYVSGARPGPPKVVDAPAAGRVCHTSLGPFTETIEAYDVALRHVAYSARGEKMPGFVRSLVNGWTVRSVGNACEVRLQLNADIAFPFNILMGPMMRMQFSKVLREATEELKHFAETGKPHPRKLKVDRSKKAVQARAAFA